MVYIERIGRYDNAVIDIDNDIVKFNDKVLDNKSRKNIANELKSLIPELLYRLKRGIVLNEDERLIVTVSNEINNAKKIYTIKIGDIEIKREIFKNTYRNVRLYCDIQSGEDTWYLMEGCRHLSLEEMRHIIDLIYQPENTTFCLELDLC